MWKCIIRRGIPDSFKKLGKSVAIQSSPHLLQSQSLGLPLASAESSALFTPRCNFLSNSRFFSSNPIPENEEESPSGSPVSEAGLWNLDSGSGGSVFESEEQKDSIFGESLRLEGSNEDFGGKIDAFESRDDISDNPSPDSLDLIGQNLLKSDFFDNLSGNEGGSHLAADNDESVVMESENSEVTRLKFVEKLESLLSLLQSRGASGSLESSLEGIGLLVNEEVLLKVLETPLIPEDNLIGFFKWVVKRGQFSLTAKVVGLLVKAVSKEPRTKDAYDLWDLINDVGEKEIGVLSTEILNELICLFSNLGKTKAAHEVFTKFETFGCVPNEDTYFWIISAVSKRSLFDLACSVCEKMLNADKLPDSEKIGKIISYLCRGKKVKDAHTLYMWAKERKKFPSQYTLSCLISSLCHKEKTMMEKDRTKKSKSKTQSEDEVSPEEKKNVYWALEMLNDISEKERKHAIKPFSYVTKGLCRIGDVAAAKDLLHKMVEAGPPPGYTVLNTIITALSRAGDMEDAKNILNLMEDRGLKPDIYTYSVMLAGYVEGGAMEDACKVLDEAKRKHKKLSPCIYYSLIRGYCKLEQFDIALKYMREMKKYGVKPSASEYNSLIKLLCLKALDWKAAESLLEEMKESGLHTYGKTKCLVQAVKELEEEAAAATEPVSFA